MFMISAFTDNWQSTQRFSTLCILYFKNLLIKVNFKERLKSLCRQTKNFNQDLIKNIDT